MNLVGIVRLMLNLAVMALQAVWSQGRSWSWSQGRR